MSFSQRETAPQASATSTERTAKTGSAEEWSQGQMSGQLPEAACSASTWTSAKIEVTRNAASQSRGESSSRTRGAGVGVFPTAASTRLAARAAARARTKRQASRASSSATPSFTAASRNG